MGRTRVQVSRTLVRVRRMLVRVRRTSAPVSGTLAVVSWPLALVVAGQCLAGIAIAQSPPSLDYEYFKTRVQPIFTAKRPGHARCVSCHIAGTPLRLQPLEPGATTWSDEASRKNFEAVKRVVAPGNPDSKLLRHPLAEKAGGDFFHNGGKHWASESDPEWQTLRAWVMGDTKRGSQER